MPLEIVTLPRVPVLRTGHYDLESGEADFAIEHLTAAADALANDPAVLPLRIRLELEDGQGHLDADGIVSEANGVQGGPAVGWGDNYAVAGNTLYADLHVPSIVAESMEWAFPARSIEGLWGYTTATGHQHDFIATGLLLLGQSWPGVTTLPDFAEVQAEFAADVAEGAIEVPSYATATGRVPEAAAVVARVGASGRPPRSARQELATAGLNVADLRMRWLAAEANGELEGLPDSYDYWSWYPVETRARDDGTLAVYVMDEDTGSEWEFVVESVADGQVRFSEPVEVVRPDPVPLAAAGVRPRPPLARYASRAEGRAGAASSPPTTHHQEDERPMTDAQRRALASRLGLDPETATEEDIYAAAETQPQDPPETPPEGDPPEGDPPEGDEAPEGEPAGVAARTATISRERLAELERQAAAGAAAEDARTHVNRDRLVLAALADGRILPNEAGLGALDENTGLYAIGESGWRRDLEDAPEVTARALARLETGKYPGARARQGQAASVTAASRAEAVIASIRRPEETTTERRVIHR
jgi:hypothetical protein